MPRSTRTLYRTEYTRKSNVVIFRINMAKTNKQKKNTHMLIHTQTHSHTHTHLHTQRFIHSLFEFAGDRLFFLHALKHFECTLNRKIVFDRILLACYHQVYYFILNHALSHATHVHQFSKKKTEDIHNH